MEPPDEIGAIPAKIAPVIMHENNFVAVSPVAAEIPATAGKNNGKTTAVESDTRLTRPEIIVITGAIREVLEIPLINPDRYSPSPIALHTATSVAHPPTSKIVLHGTCSFNTVF